MGKEWLNGVVKSLTQLVGTNHIVTSAYRPNTNGLQERNNSTLCEALRVFCSMDGNIQDWDLKLPYVVMSYNLMRNSSRKVSPHELLFARKMNHFEDYTAISKEWEVPMILKRAAEIKLLNEVTLPLAIDNLLHAQVQQRKSQDKAHNVQFETLKVGSKVMLWDPKIKGKLEQRKSGPYLIAKLSAKNNYFLTNCKTNVNLKNAIPLRRLQAVEDSVTEFDETLTTNYDIIKIISTRGQVPNIEFLEWKNKPKDKKTWVLESNLKDCPDQNNTSKLIEAYKSHINTRMTTRQTGKIMNNSLGPLIMLILLFLPLISAGEVFGNFKFCSISKNSKILNYEQNCQLMDSNPVYNTKNFTILEKRQHMIEGEVHACWAEIIWVRSWRMWFFFPAEERLTPQRILLSIEQCWDIINNRVIFDQKLKCDNNSYCVSYVEPIILDYPHIGSTYYKGLYHSC